MLFHRGAADGDSCCYFFLSEQRQQQKMFPQMQCYLRTNRRDASPALTAIAVYRVVKTQKRSGRLDRNVAAILENENVAHKGKNG